MSKFLLRVDDCGWRPEDKSNDVNLAYFRRWHKALNPAGSPIFLGFIPTTVTQHELRALRSLLSGDEVVAVHGHDHAAGAIVSESEMRTAAEFFDGWLGDVPAYIPPFNVYTPDTMRDWGRAVRMTNARAVFFGGFDEPDGDHHHTWGDLPQLFYGAAQVLHIPALRYLYDRAPSLITRLTNLPECAAPRVVTLHATWDVNTLEALGPLMDLLRPNLITASEAYAWQQRTQFTVQELTGPHFVAMSWVCQRIQQLGLRVMDFGAGHSKLAAQLALRGCHVLAADRDPTMPAKQQEHAKRFGVTVDTRHWRGTEAWDGDEQFDVISSCWAIQHNTEPGEIEAVSRNLYARVKPGGRLLIISSRSAGESRTDRTRVDPQVILNDADFNTRVVQAAGWQMGEQMLFRYAHAQESFDLHASPDLANAACYTLVKPKE